MVGGLLSDVSTGASPSTVVGAGVITAIALLLGALYPFYKGWQQSRKEARDAAAAAVNTDAEIDKLKERIKRLERSLRHLREKVNDE